MTTAGNITVYFLCAHCGSLYRAKQVRFAEPVSGRFKCEKCREPVHCWTGTYGYLYWEPVKARRSRR